MKDEELKVFWKFYNLEEAGCKKVEDKCIDAKAT
jgi:hypothetical protein